MVFSISKKINKFAGKSRLTDALAIFCARYLVYLMTVCLLLIALIDNNWRIFFYPFLSGLFGAFIINTLVYIFYKERRPAGLKGTKVLIPVPSNPSFPSRHSAFIFGMSSCLFFYSTPLALFFLVCSCFVGVARVFCGVHWLQDVLAGILVGFLSALIIISISNIARF